MDLLYHEDLCIRIVHLLVLFYYVLHYLPVHALLLILLSSTLYIFHLHSSTSALATQHQSCHLSEYFTFCAINAPLLKLPARPTHPDVVTHTDIIVGVGGATNSCGQLFVIVH